MARVGVRAAVVALMAGLFATSVVMPGALAELGAGNDVTAQGEPDNGGDSQGDMAVPAPPDGDNPAPPLGPDDGDDEEDEPVDGDLSSGDLDQGAEASGEDLGTEEAGAPEETPETLFGVQGGPVGPEGPEGPPGPDGSPGSPGIMSSPTGMRTEAHMSGRHRSPSRCWKLCKKIIKFKKRGRRTVQVKTSCWRHSYVWMTKQHRRYWWDKCCLSKAPWWPEKCFWESWRYGCKIRVFRKRVC